MKHKTPTSILGTKQVLDMAVSHGEKIVGTKLIKIAVLKTKTEDPYHGVDYPAEAKTALVIYLS